MVPPDSDLEKSHFGVEQTSSDSWEEMAMDMS